jgi:hypothetical protein
MTVVGESPIRVEFLAREDCPNRGMALHVLERAIAESGVHVTLKVVDVKSEAQAQRRQFLGSPSVRVDGIDVEPGACGRTDFTLACRLYRCGQGGLQGWPDASWIRGALLVASAQSPSNGNGASERSSSTSP